LESDLAGGRQVRVALIHDEVAINGNRTQSRGRRLLPQQVGSIRRSALLGLGAQGRREQRGDQQQDAHETEADGARNPQREAPGHPARSAGSPDPKLPTRVNRATDPTLPNRA